MKIFKRGTTFGKDRETLGSFLVTQCLMWAVSAVSGIWQLGRMILIGASWIPLPPLQWLGLSAAVSQGRLKSVQRLAKPAVFKTMPWFVNDDIVRKAGEKAKGYTTLEHKEVFNTLLRNGAVVTQKSFYRDWLFTVFTLDHLLEDPKRAALSIQHNAIHDDTKYEMFMHCLNSHSTLLNQLTEPMMVQWADFFVKLQENNTQRTQLWNNIVKNRFPFLVEKLVKCTPVAHLTPERLYNIFDCGDTTRGTFDALIAKGLDIEDMLLASAHSKSQCVIVATNTLAPNTPKINGRVQQKWLERNPSLKEVVEHARNVKQKTRLIDSIAHNEIPNPPYEEMADPILQRKRKM